MLNRSSLIFPALIVAGGIIVFFIFLILLSGVSLPFAGAIIVAFIFSPIVDWLERHHIPRWLGSLLILFLILALLVSVMFWLFPLLFNELELMIKGLPELSTTLEEFRLELDAIFPLANWQEIFDDLLSGLKGLAGYLMTSAPDIISGFLMTVYYSVIIPFLIFFFLKDGREIVKSFVNLIPNRWFEMSVITLHEIDLGIGRFLRGLLIENSIIAFLAVFGLGLIGMPSALLVGILIGVFNVIPYMGPTIGFVIASIMTLIDPSANPPLLAVLAVVACVQLVDNALVYPLAIGKSVHMHPVNVIAALLLGGMLMGIIGMLLAVPLATTIIVIYKSFFRAWKDYRSYET